MYCHGIIIYACEGYHAYQHKQGHVLFITFFYMAIHYLETENFHIGPDEYVTKDNFLQKRWALYFK